MTRIDEYHYELPPERIAKYPPAQRDASRLLLAGRRSGELRDEQFCRLAEVVRGNELVVLNNARVFPARLYAKREGVKAEPVGRGSRVRREHLSARIEVLLVRCRSDEEGIWEVLVRPGRKVRVGERLVFGDGELQGEVLDRGDYGLRTIRFSSTGEFRETVERLGHVPLPPYIDREDEEADRDRYQTVFAKRWGAVAAPTAGLHFTRETLARLKEHGCEVAEITLDVGYGTFQPIHAAAVERHRMHAERYEIPRETADAVERARREGRPVLAIGTTVVRALESGAAKGGGVKTGKGETELFIYPGYEFQVVDQLLTNFHLPRSSLLILVSAFAGRENVLAAYRHAVEAGYRFYSYGDCMLIR